jgi:hypothetical protein
LDFFVAGPDLGFAAGAGRSVPVRRAPKRSATRSLIAATFAVISSLLTCGRAVVVLSPSTVFTP